MKAVLLTEGSIPPAQALYACVHELDNRPFSDAEIIECRRKLAANYFIRDVRVHSKEMDNSWNVEFVLRGDSLNVDELAVDTFDDQQASLVKLLSLSDHNLHVGGTYSVPAELSTYEGIRQFYRARGQLVGVVPRVELDYRQGKASVHMSVVPGPTIPSHPLVPPYGDPCGDRITYISWWDTDDGVPVELVESGLALRSPFSCFSEELAQRDKTYLSNIALLTKHLVDYSGAVGNRHIQYKLRAKPLKVDQIELRGFGNVASHPKDNDPSLLNNLPLRTGNLFSNSAQNKSIEYLKGAFSKKGYWTEVTARQELIDTDSLRVTLSVFAFPLQTVIVDGREIN
jgi:hypothetical protein